jgi:hypothetical protein
VHAPAAVVTARINPAVGIVEAVDDHSCVLTTGADSVKTVAVYLGLLDADFTVSEPPELVEQLQKLATATTAHAPQPRRGPAAPLLSAGPRRRDRSDPPSRQRDLT